MKKESQLLYSLLAVVLCLVIASCNNTNRGNQTEEETTQHSSLSLSQVWKTDTTFTGSESVLYSPDSNVIYVSCGNAGDKDGDGFIALLNLDGSVNNMNWVSGLDAPKGMAILNGKLYVTDVDNVKIIDIATAAIEKTIPVEGAKFLNDLASDGTSIYFSDSQTGTIYSLSEAGKVTAIITTAEGVNGLACDGGNLYALDKEGLKKYDIPGYTSVLLNSEVTGGDGLVILNDSTFLASRWAGEIYLIKGSETNLLIDTKAEKSNTADITFIPDQNLVLVPTFMKHEVAAYELK